MGKRSKGEGSIYRCEDEVRDLWVGQIYLPTRKKIGKYGKTQKEAL